MEKDKQRKIEKHIDSITKDFGEIEKDKIPTARDIAIYIIESGATIDQCEEKIKNYTKLHVKAALEAATKQAKIEQKDLDYNIDNGELRFDPHENLIK